MLKNKITHLNILYLFAVFILLASKSIIADDKFKVNIEPPKLTAKAYYLLDYDSGTVLASKNHGEQIDPASITKIMTSYVVFYEIKQENVSLDDLAVIGSNAREMIGSRMFVELNSRVSIRDLLMGLIVQSGNDAAVALAEHVAGSESAFVELMNRHATALGMNNTYFVNSTGMPDPNHKTTAHDLAILASALIRDFPDYYSWYAEKKFTHNKITQNNRNKLLWQDSSVDGIKTGHTNDAGYCLVSSAIRNDARLIAVVMGASSKAKRNSDSQNLLNFGYRFFETRLLYPKKDIVTTAMVWKGEEKNVTLGVTEDIHLTLTRNQYKKIKQRIKIGDSIEAPVKQGDQLGVIEVSVDGEKVASYPLVALENIASGSLFRVIIDSVKMKFSSSSD